MRVLFAGLANHGHLYPMFPLAVACRLAGHHVAIATGKEFHSQIESVGLGASRSSPRPSRVPRSSHHR
jgi:UDP:flavonoid glycosyltransferase YjiC (YdhE family)